MAEIYFTMIIYVDNDTMLKRAINSMVGDSVKIVVVDAICSEASMNLCDAYKRKYGKANFLYIEAPDKSIGEAYNAAIPEIEGRYVNFSLASTWFSTSTLESVRYIAEREGRPKLISLSPWTVNEKQETLQYKMSPVALPDVFTEEIHLNQEPNRLQLMFHAYFIRCYLINSKERHMWFRPELFEDATIEMLCNLLAEIRTYLYLPKSKIHYTKQLEDNTSTFEHQYKEWWYLDSMQNWVLPFAREWNSRDYPLRTPIRILLFYLVYARFNCNYNDRNKGVLHGENLQTFLKLTGEVLQYVDNQLIFSKETFTNFVIPRNMRMLFLELKAKACGKVCETVFYDKQLLLWTHREEGVTENTISSLQLKDTPETEELSDENKIIDHTNTLFVVERGSSKGDSDSSDHKDPVQNNLPVMKWAYEDDALLPLCDIQKEHVIIRAINYRRGKLEIDGILSLGNFFSPEKIKLKIIRDGQRETVKFSEVYGLEKVFGVTNQHKYMFFVTVPVLYALKCSKLQFVIDINGDETVLQIHTQSVYSHVKENVKGQYWRFAKDWCLTIVGKNEMHLTMVTQGEVNTLEANYQKELLAKSKKGDKTAAYAVELRKEYFAHKKKFPNERIWITFDKLYKAGDNGEYIYDYISAQEGDIDIRYIIKSDSPDFERMKEKGDNLLIWGDKETLVTVLCAEAILATHSNIASYVGFDKKLIPYICDLFSPIIACIQHGLTVQDIAQYQNRLFDNLQLYLCASPNEIANVSRPIYGFTEKESLKLVGMARYDGLHNNDQRQILITPTWRRDIANSDVAHVKKGHNNSFKNSEYFHIYNRLINDKKLIGCAKKYKYKVIYLLHPATSAQIDDFDRNDYVELIPAASDMSYEKILTESSLMVTDFSGVQFDFAYMRKPLIYYHPSTIPPHYNESEAYQYERDAFGPIIDNHEELVDTICDYMKSNCHMKEEYKERADRFFAYNDFNNCERIYRVILDYIDDEREHDND